MELELGLALPISTHFPTQKLKAVAGDRHQNVKNAAGQLPLEFKNLMVMMNGHNNNKRSFADAFDVDEDDDTDQGSKKTLSLLVWNGRRPTRDDGDGEEKEGRNCRKDEDEDGEIVGWPPIRTWRKKLLSGGGGGDHHRNVVVGGGGGINHNNRNSIFVKVKMEGVMIGRKIDLRLFDSYQSLINTLLHMFAKYKKQGDNDNDNDNDNEDGAYSYILSYLDKDGDWLLAGDVPWQTFIESVQRLEILKRRSSKKE